MLVTALHRRQNHSGSTIAATGSVTMGTSTSTSVDWPSPISSGDLIILIYSSYQDVPTNLVAQGFTNIFESGTQGFNRMSAFYKVATGAESGSFTVNDNYGYPQGIGLLHVTGWGGNVSTDIEGAYCGHPATSVTSYNPGAISPSWGSATTLFIACLGAIDDAATVTVAPSNMDYSADGTIGGENSGSCLGIAWHVETTSSFDPNTWTINKAEGVICGYVVVK